MTPTTKTEDPIAEAIGDAAGVPEPFAEAFAGYLF